MVKIDPSFMRFYPHELSGGMKQRVDLALALALQPKFVLLDEPTTGLDVLVQRSILDNVRALQREQGFAVLLISHDLGTVLEVSDRVMVMYAGEHRGGPAGGRPCSPSRSTPTPTACSARTPIRAPRPSRSPTSPAARRT